MTYRVPAEAVGSTLELPGSTVVITLPQGYSAVSLSWDSVAAEDSSPSGSFTIFADIIQTPEDGELTWSPGRKQERIWWIIGLGQPSNDAIEWRTKVDSNDCNWNHPCTCLSFEAYEISREGYLVEIAKSAPLLSTFRAYSLHYNVGHCFKMFDPFFGTEFAEGPLAGVSERDFIR